MLINYARDLISNSIFNEGGEIMPKLKVAVLGTPTVKLDEKLLNFPYKKVEALLYYLVVQEKTSRNKLATLLWGNMLEGKAKKNLRNALYQLKKTTGDGIIATPDRFTVTISEDCDLQLDLDEFLAREDERSIELYRGNFLKGFLIKNASAFTDWTFEQKNYYEQLYIKRLKKEIKNCKEAEDIQNRIYYLESLIEVDEFDELAYRNLMEFYSKQGNTAKAIEIYQVLEERLQDELGITPNRETIKLFQNIKENKPSKLEESSQENNNFIGRRSELEELLTLLTQFITDRESYSCFIFGEAGIGKTALVQQALSLVKLEDALVLETNCYQVEERYIFKPWKNILQQIQNRIDIDELGLSLSWQKIAPFLFPSFLAEEEAVSEGMLNFESIQEESAIDAFIFLLTEVAKEKKLVILFEDLQWCDDKSLLLLKRLIQENKNRNILLLATSRNERRKRIQNLFADLRRYDFLRELRLSRLSLMELENFTQQFLPEHNLSKELLNRIYKETEGNVFFLVELLNLLAKQDQKDNLPDLMTAKCRDILQNRFLSVSEEAQKILMLISACFDKVSYNLLADISGKNDLELIELLEELQNYYLIEETVSNSQQTPIYSFTHSKLREFIYKQQSFSRKRLIHSRIAQFLEQKLQTKSNNRDYYAKLIYHYSKAGDKVKHLEYLIKEAEIYFLYTHELFPLINDNQLEKEKVLSFNQKESENYLKEIKELLKEIKQEEKRSVEVRKLEVKFLNMKVRNLIAKGDYDTAITHIQQMIPEAESTKDWNSLMDAYQQLGGLAIQKEKFELLKDCAEKMYSLAKRLSLNIKEGIALRYLGIAKLYKGYYKEAEDLFNQALELFKNSETLGKKYTLGIAVAYNYLGEVKRYEGELEAAVDFYEAGIKICEDKNIFSGLGIFYVNAGRTLFELEDYSTARDYFKKSLKIFDKLTTIWGYSTVANAFMALLSIQLGDYKEAYDYLMTADSVINIYHKRYWLGILFYVKGEVAKEMAVDNRLAELFEDYLIEEPESYFQDALSIFKEIGTDYEIKSII